MRNTSRNIVVRTSKRHSAIEELGKSFAKCHNTVSNSPSLEKYVPFEWTAPRPPAR